ncbi:MAG: restriction endonuclease subunit S [Halothiobacillaceae bacterium]
MITHEFTTIIGDIPEGWRSVELRRLLLSQFAGDWGDEDGDVAVKILRSTNFTDAGHLDFSDVAVRYFSERSVEKFGLKNGDILLERSGGGPDQPVGRVGFISNDLGWFWVSNFVQVLRPDPEKINTRYLGWVLFELQRTGMVERFQQQSTQIQNLNYRDYLRMLIPVPPEPIQESIAEAIDSITQTIANLSIEIDAARRVKDSMLQSLLTGKTLQGER